MRRRLLALALVFLPVQGSASTLVAGASPGHSHCSGDVCRCAARGPSHCPPKRQASIPSCHETRAPLGALVQAAGCQGSQDEAGAPVSTRPQLAPAPFDVGPAFRTSALAPVPPRPARPGFVQIDLPPPRTA